jgi:hypothetical protein
VNLGSSETPVCIPWVATMDGGGGVYLLSGVQLFGTQWTVAHQAALSMGFARQEYSSEFPFTVPGGLPDRCF